VVALAGCDETGAPVTVGSPTGITGEMRADYLDAVASVGCVLRDERQYGAVDFQADLTREETRQITGFYLGSGRAERLASDPDAIRIKAGPCAGQGGAA
jgi:hypothetical protein